MSPETKEVLEELRLGAWKTLTFYEGSGVEKEKGIVEANKVMVGRIDSLLNPPPVNPVVAELSSLRDSIWRRLDSLPSDTPLKEGMHIAFQEVIDSLFIRIEDHERSSSVV